jgi:hypothetical protein
MAADIGVTVGGSCLEEKITTMEILEQQVEIKWPVRALFNYVADIDNNAIWQGDVAYAEWLGDYRNCSGARFRELRKSVDCEHIAECEIAEFIPDQKRTIVVADEPFFSTHTMEFEQHATHSVMKLTVKIENFGRTRGTDASRHFLQKRIIDLNRLKTLLESDSEN